MCRLLRPHESPEDNAELLRLSQKDVDRGSGEGFYTRVAVGSRFGVGAWRPLPRYVIKQEHNSKFRAIDNGRASGRNAATVTRERVHTTSLEFFASASKQFLQRRDFLQREADCLGAPLLLEIGVDDEEEAYRKYATADSHACWSVVAFYHHVWGTVAFMPLIGHAFGLKASVNHYNRSPGLWVAVVTRLLAVCATHYYDDFAVVDSSLGKGTARAALVQVANLCGITFGKDRSTHEPQSCLCWLFARRWCSLQSWNVGNRLQRGSA